MDGSLPRLRLSLTLALGTGLLAQVALGADYLPDRRGRIFTHQASPWEAVAPLDRDVSLYRPKIGTILRVGPGGAFTSIQSAIDRARPGDVVLVTAGIYKENLLFPPSPVILIGEGGAEKTIIDGRGCARGVDLCSTIAITQAGGEGHWIEGLTLIGGQGTAFPEADPRAWDPYADPALGGAPSLGGGLFSTQGGVTVMSCVIKGGGGDLGGGVALLGAHPQLMSDVMERSGMALRGGWSSDYDAQETNGPDLTLGETAIIQNRARLWGGGVYVDGARLVVQGGRISGNQSTIGGGLALRSGEAFLTEVELLKDRGSLMGGAIYADGGRLGAVNVAMVGGFSPEGALAYVQGGRVSFEDGYGAFPQGGAGFQVARGVAFSLDGLHGAAKEGALFGPRVDPSSLHLASLNDIEFLDLSLERPFTRDNLGAWRRGEPDAEPGLLVDVLNTLEEEPLPEGPLGYLLPPAASHRR